MSKKGIEKAAKVFEVMHTARRELMEMACDHEVIDKQDLRLSHMLEDGKNAMKDTFGKLTLLPLAKP